MDEARRAEDAAVLYAVYKDTTRQGQPCRRCGSTERYVSTGACAPCTRSEAREAYRRNPDAAQEKRAWRAGNPGRHRDTVLRARYGLSLEDYEERLAAQGGVCAVCREACSSGRRLSVDHDHVGGSVRGLLCTNCNRGVGNFRDNPELLRRAAEYLEAGCA